MQGTSAIMTPTCKHRSPPSKPAPMLPSVNHQLLSPPPASATLSSPMVTKSHYIPDDDHLCTPSHTNAANELGVSLLASRSNKRVRSPAGFQISDSKRSRTGKKSDQSPCSGGGAWPLLLSPDAWPNFTNLSSPTPAIKREPFSQIDLQLQSLQKSPEFEQQPAKQPPPVKAAPQQAPPQPFIPAAQAPAAPAVPVPEKLVADPMQLTAGHTPAMEAVSAVEMPARKMTQEERQKNKFKRQEEVMQAIGTGNVTEKIILDLVGDSRYTREILRRLLAQGVVMRVGKGGSNDPFLYTVVQAMINDDGKAMATPTLVDPGLEVRLRRIENKIMTQLSKVTDFTTEKTIRLLVGDNTGTGKALRRMVASGKVIRVGKGGVADPYKYRYNNMYVGTGSPPMQKPMKKETKGMGVTTSSTATKENILHQLPYMSQMNQINYLGMGNYFMMMNNGMKTASPPMPLSQNKRVAKKPRAIPSAPQPSMQSQDGASAPRSQGKGGRVSTEYIGGLEEGDSVADTSLNDSPKLPNWFNPNYAGDSFQNGDIGDDLGLPVNLDDGTVNSSSLSEQTPRRSPGEPMRPHSSCKSNIDEAFFAQSFLA